MSPPADSSVLLSAADLTRRIAQLAAEIAPGFAERGPILVAVLEGARTFAGQLCARLPGRPQPFGIRAASYGSGTQSNGEVRIDGGEDIPVRDRHILLLEDIVDTGRTVRALRHHLHARGAADIQVATLLSKPSRRVVDVALHHVGFEIPDQFVIGFGMDLDGRYRELPEIRTLSSGAASATGL